MKFIYSVGLVFVSLGVFAQQQITGRVVDQQTGEGLIGAHVYLLGNWRKGVITDVEGRFRLILQAEEMMDSLIVSYVGFGEVIAPISEAMSIQLRAC